MSDLIEATRDVHGATPQASPQAHHEKRNEAPRIYSPSSSPEADENGQVNPAQEVCPDSVVAANKFIVSCMQLLQPLLLIHCVIRLQISFVVLLPVSFCGILSSDSLLMWPPELVGSLATKEPNRSWEEQMGMAANQQATPNLLPQSTTQMRLCSGPKVRFYCTDVIAPFFAEPHIVPKTGDTPKFQQSK